MQDSAPPLSGFVTYFCQLFKNASTNSDPISLEPAAGREFGRAG
jgi:hypothetical protein